MEYRVIDYTNVTVISPYDTLFPVTGVAKIDGEGWRVTYQQSNHSVPKFWPPV